MRTFFISDNLPVEETSDGDLAILAMGGELDYEASPQLRARLVGAIKAGGGASCSTSPTSRSSTRLRSASSPGTVARLDEAGGGSLAVVSTHEKVLQIFEITGLDSVISLHSSREEAVSAFSPGWLTCGIRGRNEAGTHAESELQLPAERSELGAARKYVGRPGGGVRIRSRHAATSSCSPSTRR